MTHNDTRHGGDDGGTYHCPDCGHTEGGGFSMLLHLGTHGDLHERVAVNDTRR